MERNTDAVQPWSAGPLFPAVIKRVEEYAEPMARDVYDRVPGSDYDTYVAAFRNLSPDIRLRSTSWTLIYPGIEEVTGFASYDEAALAAEALNRYEAFAAAGRAKRIGQRGSTAAEGAADYIPGVKDKGGDPFAAERSRSLDAIRSRDAYIAERANRQARDEAHLARFGHEMPEHVAPGNNH